MCYFLCLIEGKNWEGKNKYCITVYGSHVNSDKILSPQYWAENCWEEGGYFQFPILPSSLHISFSLSPLSYFPIVLPHCLIAFSFHRCLPSLWLHLGTVVHCCYLNWFASFWFSHFGSFPAVPNPRDSPIDAFLIFFYAREWRGGRERGFKLSRNRLQLSKLV